jgi:hypothetical protein
MAPGTGMAGFVQDRNGDAPPDLGDLKRTVPSTKDERKQKSKNNALHREKSQSSRLGRHPGNASLKSNNSSADNLSTTASTTRQKSGGDQRLETRSRSYDRQGTNGDQHAAMFGGTDYNEDPDADQDLPENPMMAEKFSRMYAESRVANGSPTIAQTHIKGDSYPPTSAGAPSVTDQRDRNEIRAPGGLQNLPTHAANRSIYGARAQKPQLPPTSTHHQPPATARAREQAPVTTHQMQDTKPLESEPPSDFDASAGFSYGRAPTVKKEVAVHVFRPQKQPVNPKPLTVEAKADSLRPRQEPTTKASAQGDPALGEPLASTERHAYQHERQPRVTEVQSYHNHHGDSAGQALMSDQGPASDVLTEEDPAEQLEQHQVFDEEPLDYGLQELYNKDYASLQGEPFDHGPNGQPFIISGLSDSAVLTEKLVHLKGAEPKTQADFFESLNIDDWEEAGDWFLDRFGETIKRLKDIRREKRKAARAFEDEIEVRETAVNKKRTLTHAAMIEMKTSGAAVLQGTPGKKR